MRTYGRIASLPSSYLQKQKYDQSVLDFANALQYFGASVDDVELSLMLIARPEDIPPASGDASMEARF